MDNTIIVLLIINIIVNLQTTIQSKALRGRVYRYMDWVNNFEDKAKRLKIADYKEN